MARGKNLRVSLGARAKPSEVQDKMTTVRGVTSGSGQALMAAMAAVTAAGGDGRNAMSKLRDKLDAANKANRLSHKK